MSATRLRANLYQVLDHVLETGQPQGILRHGRRLEIVAVDAGPRLDLEKLPRRHATDLSPEALAEVSWEGAWSGGVQAEGPASAAT